jgi:glycerate kinase
MDITGFEEELKTADLILTGEGKIDKQTFQGKVIDGVARLAGKYNIPILAVCGDMELKAQELKKHGIIESRSLVNHFGSLEKALKNTRIGIIEITKILLEHYITASP